MIIANPLPELDDGRKPIQGSGFADHLKRTPPSKTPGVDLHYRGGMPNLTPVLAAAAGVVERAQQTRRGDVVVINHGQGVKTVYRHLRNLKVAKGQPVLPAQPIGDGSFDPQDSDRVVHLHFELFVNGRRLDPGPLLRAAPITKPSILPPDTPPERLEAVLRETREATTKARGGSLGVWVLAAVILVLLMSSNR